MTLSGLVGLSIATGFTVALTLFLGRVARAGRPALDVAILGCLWVVVVTADLFLHGLAGYLDPRAIAISNGTGLVLLGLLRPFRRATVEAVADVRSWGRVASAAWGDLPGWLRLVTGAWAVVSISRFLVLVWALPPFVWDSLTYHLTNVAHWIQAGRLEVFDVPVVRIYLPANNEVFTTWFAVFNRHDGWIEAAGLPAYALIGVAVYAAARGVGLTRTAAWIAALGMASTPAVVLAATGTKNDPLMAALFLTLLAIVIDIAVDLRRRVDRPVYGRWLSILVLGFFALGTKPYILHLMPGALVAGALIAGPTAIGPLRRSLTALAREVRHLATPLLMASAALLVASLVLGTFWYIRNLILQGNPFYPYGVSVAGREVAAPESDTRTLDLSTLWANLNLVADKFGDKSRRITPDLTDTTGWGWVAYGMGLPALAWGVIRVRSVRVLALGFTLAGLLLLASSPSSPWNMRYAIWFPAVLCLALGAAWDGLRGQARARGAVATLFIVCLGLNFTATLNYNLVRTDVIRAMVKRPFRDRQAAYLRVHVPYEYENALIHTPETDVLGYNVHANGFIYPLYRADFSQRLVYVRIDPGQTCADVAQSMRDAGTRRLVVAPEHTQDSILQFLHACAERGVELRELGAGLYVTR